jgi:hypothetical protein
MIWNREPALFYGLVNTVLALILAFGVDLSTEQTGAILAATSAVLAVITRSKVTPAADDAHPEAGAIDLTAVVVCVILLVIVLVLVGRV